MAYIKRAKHYSIVRGITRGENGELVDTEVVVNGACRTADMAMKKSPQNQQGHATYVRRISCAGNAHG